MTATTLPASWQGEQHRWQTVYRNLQASRLAWAVQFVQQASPAQVRTRLDSLLTLLNNSRRNFDSCSTQVNALIQALHPWPLRWGYWNAWEEQLRFILEHARTLSRAQRARYQMHLAGICANTGRKAETGRLYERALHLARHSDDLLTLAEVTCDWTFWALDEGQLQAAQRALTDLRSRNLPPQASPYKALMHMAVLRHQGRSQAAVQIVRQALEAAGNADTDLLARLWEWRATLEWDLDRFTDALESLQRASSLYHQMGHRLAESGTLGNIGLVYWSIFALDKAEAALRQSLRLSEELNARRRMVVEIGNLGLVYLTRGDLATALRYLQRQYLLARRVGYDREAWRARGNLGIACFCQGKYARALPLLLADRDFSQNNNLLGSLGVALIHLGVLYARLGDLEKTRRVLQEATQVIAGMHSEVLTALLWRAQAFVLPSRQAAFYLRQALDVAMRYHRPLDEAACRLLLARHTPDRQASMALWQQGREILQGLQATAWLQNASPEDPPILPFLR